MTQYKGLNVKLSNSQLNKVKSAIRVETEIVLRLTSNMIGNSNDETNFPHELLLTNTQIANVHDIKLSKTQISKMMQSGEFLVKFLVVLLKTGLALKKMWPNH